MMSQEKSETERIAAKIDAGLYGRAHNFKDSYGVPVRQQIERGLEDYLDRMEQTFEQSRDA